MNTLNRRSSMTVAAALLAAHATTERASGQYYSNFDCKVAITINPPLCGEWGAVKAKQFVHAFEAQFWTPISASYTPRPQPAGFDEYGCEYYYDGRITNRCFICYPRYNPPMTAAWLERPISINGTPLGGFWALAQPGSSGTRAYSQVDMDPWGSNGPLSMKLRSQSRWGELPSGSWGRGFSFTEVHLPLRIDPNCVGGGMVPMVVSFQGMRWEWLYGDNWGWSPIPLPRSYQRNRVFDPVTFRATRDDGSLIEEGTLMESTIDMLGSGPADINFEETFEGSGQGNLMVTALDADIRISVGHPRLTGATGSLFLSIRGGMVVQSEDSGLHDGLLPPVGTVSPFAVPLQMSHPIMLDLNGLSAEPFDLLIVSGEGGAQPIEEVVHCPADVNHDLQVTPADVATFVSNWFQSLQTFTLAGDFDGNGVVNPADVAAFVGEWAAAVAGGC